MGFSRPDLGYSRTVSYVNRNHLGVMTQRWGSVNRKVLPFCVANVALTVVLVWLLNHGIDLSISEFGHEFMSMLVAFLVINKLSFTLGLYYELQGHLSKMNQASVELTQLACSYTKGYQTHEIRDWRFQVTRQVLILLKVSVSVMHKGGENCVWEIPELKHEPLTLALDGGEYPTMINGDHGSSRRRSGAPHQIYEFGYNLPSDKNLRAPIRIAQRLRDVITYRKNFLVDPLDTIQERALLAPVKEFMDSYYGVRKYLTCPLPLPLVQLGRIFVVFYVFTLPFALLSEELNLAYSQMTVLICLMTYGFMGMELLFVEIDDPFSDDPNDLPLTEEAQAAAEDIILNLLHADGAAAVDGLRKEFLFVKHRNSEPSERDRLV
jgi:hypothetical protein